jgi:hypothetical protein
MDTARAGSSMSSRRRMFFSVVSVLFAVTAFIGLPVYLSIGIQIHFQAVLWTVIKACLFWALLAGTYLLAKEVLVDHLRSKAGLETAQTYLWLKEVITLCEVLWRRLYRHVDYLRLLPRARKSIPALNCHTNV